MLYIRECHVFRSKTAYPVGLPGKKEKTIRMVSALS